MRKLWTTILIAAGSASIYAASMTVCCEEQAPHNPVLVLYDAPDEGTSAKLGYTFSIMVRNLLGHFEMDADIRPVQTYKRGQINDYSTIFYLGVHYDNPLPDAFLKDVSTTRKTVVWFKYNLWQLDWPGDQGFHFIDLRGFNTPPSPSNPKPGFFDTILYKGKSLVKYYQYDPASNDIQADPDVGEVAVDIPAKVKVWSKVRNSRTGEELPYAIQGGPAFNFWYFADLPLTYIGPRDRYLAFCDLLHDILGIQHAEDHRAMVRLEDVGAKVLYVSMRRLVDYLQSRNIPFSVAAFPSYRDPLGAENDGEPETIPLAQATELQRSLHYALDHGGALVMHGYTHQYDSRPNPHTGVSADDFEFWDAINNAPVKEDSMMWALNRIDAGLKEFKDQGFIPFAWETPHYQGSPESHRAFVQRFRTTYQRVIYYSTDKPVLDRKNPNRDFAAGMFFPYIISRDFYGQRVIPENIGNIEYDISKIDPTSNIVYTWNDLYQNAEYAWIVRDGFASFFFHPFWIDPGFERLDAFNDFQKLVDGISKLGYHWVGGAQLQALPNRQSLESVTNLGQ